VRIAKLRQFARQPGWCGCAGAAEKDCG